MASKTWAILFSTLTANRAGPSAKSVGPNSVSFTYGCNRRRAVRLPVVRAQVTGDGKDATRTQGNLTEREKTRKGLRRVEIKRTRPRVRLLMERKRTWRGQLRRLKKRETRQSTSTSAVEATTTNNNNKGRQWRCGHGGRPLISLLLVSTFFHRGGVL